MTQIVFPENYPSMRLSIDEWKMRGDAHQQVMQAAMNKDLQTVVWFYKEKCKVSNPVTLARALLKAAKKFTGFPPPAYKITDSSVYCPDMPPGSRWVKKWCFSVLELYDGYHAPGAQYVPVKTGEVSLSTLLDHA